ncbi:hypothetical protein BG842_10415 [Haladaptatus sp. W1]|uniref:BGTF surface domain-containing protein n=1 Tax=Haladaptatus sp. W1 TaxID=1897478 RepID=UPI000849BDBE|nr:BGTF surface domain-containing protein [Haladaptatus sp. W1]ODR83528.1 hypothetical protein BG842_10415 [Haladaptatus sp. W1]
MAIVALSTVSGVTSARGSTALDATGKTPLSHDQTTANNSSVSIYHEDVPLVLNAAGNQSIRGNTTLDPGTELEMQIHATNRFFMSKSMTVASNGTFAATFNFSEYEPGTKFGVIVGRPQNNSTDVDALTVVDGVLRNRTNESVQRSTTTATDTTEAATTTSTTAATDGSDAAANTTRTTSTETEMAAEAPTESEGQPGFGVFVAVVALVGLVGLGFVRRID